MKNWSESAFGTIFDVAMFAVPPDRRRAAATPAICRGDIVRAQARSSAKRNSHKSCSVDPCNGRIAGTARNAVLCAVRETTLKPDVAT